MLINEGLSLVTVEYCYRGEAAIYIVAFSQLNGVNWQFLISIDGEATHSGKIKMSQPAEIPSLLHGVNQLMIFLNHLNKPVEAVPNE